MGRLKIVRLLLVGLAFSFNAYSQSDKVDSLKAVLKSSKQSKDKIDLLHQIVWEEAPTNPKSAIEFAKESLLLSEEIADSTLIANSYNRIGLVYDYTGSFDLA